MKSPKNLTITCLQIIPGYSSRSAAGPESSGHSGVRRGSEELKGGGPIRSNAPTRATQGPLVSGSYNPGTLPSVMKPVDSSRDIETLPEPDLLEDQVRQTVQGNNNQVGDGDRTDALSTDSDNEPQFGSVFPAVGPGGPGGAKAPSTSFEQVWPLTQPFLFNQC